CGSGEVLCFAFGGPERRWASGHSDSTIRIWSAIPRRATQKVIKELGTHHLAKLWNDLAGSDAAKAYQAMGALAQASGGEVVPFFEARLRPAVGVTRKQIVERIHELNNDRFSVREKARRELEKLGSLAGESLREAAQRKPPLEVQNVIRKLLE